MNQIFNFNRFSLLVAKHWAENRKRYFLSIVAFASLLFVWYVFVMLIDDTNPLADGLQQISFFFSLFLVGPFYASQFFNDLDSRTRGTNFLMVPASTFEKFLCGFFYAIIMFFIVFLVSFYIVGFFTVSIANAVHPSYNSVVNQDVTVVKAHVINVFETRMEIPVEVTFYFMLLFFAVQSAALLGSVYFSRYSYIKTAISLTLVCVIVFVLEYNLTKNLMPRGRFFEGRGTYIFDMEEGKGNLVQLPAQVVNTLLFLFKYSFPPIFWITTYFRLKEKEI